MQTSFCTSPLYLGPVAKRGEISTEHIVAFCTFLFLPALVQLALVASGAGLDFVVDDALILCKKLLCVAWPPCVFSVCLVGCALRVLPAETRLTVYRRLRVPVLYKSNTGSAGS